MKCKSLPVLGLVALLMAAAGCDSGETASVEGLWRSKHASPVTYLSIEPSEVVFYQHVAAEDDHAGHAGRCYTATALEVADVSGDTFIVYDPEQPERTWRMTLEVEGDELAVLYEDPASMGEPVEKYERMRWRAAELSPRCAS